jgi:hypothetical protein
MMCMAFSECSEVSSSECTGDLIKDKDIFHSGSHLMGTLLDSDKLIPKTELQ